MKYFIVLCPLLFWLTVQPLSAQMQFKYPALTESVADKPVSLRESRNNYTLPPASENSLSAQADARRFFAPTAEGDVDGTFNASAAEGFGDVEKSVVQPDGRIIVGGSFSGAGGAARNSLVRLNPDGSLDTSFNPGGTGPNASIYALALQPDGKILIGGNGSVYNGEFRGTFTRLNADGMPDITFNAGNNADGIVESIAVQPDGKIVIGGLFSSFNSMPRNNIARLNTDGSLDASFNPGSGFNAPVLSIVAQADGRVIAGGSFTQFNGIPVGRVARLNGNGSLDATLPGGTGANSTVESIVLQPDGKILIGGRFSQFNGAASSLGVVRLNPDGTVESSFTFSGISAIVTAIGVLPDGSILLGGTVTVVTMGITSTTRGISVITGNPPPTVTFQTGVANNDILDITVQPDGKVLLGGSFTNYKGSVRRRLARLNTDGTVDNGFQANLTTAGIVNRVIPQASGQTLIGGDFEFVNNTSKKALARLNTDGSLDAGFAANAGSFGVISVVNALIVQPDGKILVGGSFTGTDTAVTNRVVRLNSDGTLDSTFNSTRTATYISDIKIQPDGKVLVGGLFSNSPNGFAAIIRLNSNGTADSSFVGFPTTQFVETITLASDGKIYVGGQLALSGGLTARGAFRLNSNGSIDTSFAFRSTNQSYVAAIAIQPDGKILLAGNLFNSSNELRSIYRVFPNGDVDPTFNQTGLGVNGTILSLLLQPDGKILIGGYFTTYNNIADVNRVARLNADGTLDASFNTGAGANAVIRDIARQADGKILLGGEFTTFNNQPRAAIVRLGSTVLRRTPFDFDGDGKADVSVFRPANGAWYLQQSAAGFTGITFGFGTDKLVPADYDGDGKTDVAVYRGGTWYIQRSSLGFYGVAFGAADDLPVPADYDGDGKTDVAVFRPSNGTWYLLQSTVGFTGVAFGQNGDKPVPADYDGDGKTDLAVNRAGTWYINRSQLGFYGVQFGDANDKLVPADYDGDGKADIAVFRPSNGTWYLQQSTNGFAGIAFGLGTDIPVPADYDGDGKADIAVFRNGTWYLNRSTQGFFGVAFGASTDQPLPNVFVR